jgi:hypothetical protein
VPPVWCFDISCAGTSHWTVSKRPASRWLNCPLTFYDSLCHMRTGLGRYAHVELFSVQQPTPSYSPPTDCVLQNFKGPFTNSGVRGSVVVKALCYKSEGRGFDTRWGEFLNLPRVYYSAFNRNEYQKHKNNNVSGGVKCGGCVGLTSLPPSMSRLSRQCGILNISQPYRPATGIALLHPLFFTVTGYFPWKHSQGR